jgi:hypothetical protein
LTKVSLCIYTLKIRHRVLEKEGRTKMYQVAITAGGVEYFFALDTKEDVKTLVNESYRVTGVKIWVDGSQLSDYQVYELVHGEYAGV